MLGSHFTAIADFKYVTAWKRKKLSNLKPHRPKGNKFNQPNVYTVHKNGSETFELCDFISCDCAIVCNNRQETDRLRQRNVNIVLTLMHISHATW
jgi:hypothetical protein